MIVKPSDIIYHIIGVELDNPNLSVDNDGLTDARNAHTDWQMGFTVNKKINSKKLIEGIAKESKLFPFFKGNKLSFNSIKDTYDETDVDPANGRGFTIKDSDVISYKFDRTKIEDIKTKVILNYYLDYSTDDFKKSTESNTEADTASEFFTQTEEGYSNSYYGIEGEQGDDPIEVKYIRDNETAEKLQRFFLAWYCNQHNICKIKLPLSYLYAEVGDITAFPTLLNGRKAYGEDYSLEGYLSSGATIRNGQEIFPYWMIMGVNKTLEYVEIDLIQMHNLVDEITNIPPEAFIDAPDLVESEELVTLNGSGTTPEEGQILTYLWTAPSSITLSDTTSQNPTFTVPELVGNETATYLFTLVVHDGIDPSLPAEHEMLAVPNASSYLEVSIDLDVDGNGVPNCHSIAQQDENQTMIWVTNPSGLGWSNNPGFLINLTGGAAWEITHSIDPGGYYIGGATISQTEGEGDSSVSVMFNQNFFWETGTYNYSMDILVDDQEIHHIDLVFFPFETGGVQEIPSSPS